MKPTHAVAATPDRLLPPTAFDDPPAADPARAAMIDGLLQRPARLASKYFYDGLGSALYGAITRLPEYYPSRIEAQIVAEHLVAIARELPRGAQWVDLGCGDGAKATRWLQATQARRYIGVDSAEDWLGEALQAQLRAHPKLDVVGVVADLSTQWSLRNVLAESPAPAVFFYPGSSIGNFERDDAIALLRIVRAHCDAGSRLLVGVDLTQDPELLHAAYDDALGVTAAFNLNILRVANRMLGANFDPLLFAHEARFDAVASRVEMRLVARHPHRVHLGTPPCTSRNFEMGDAIITEYSHKYTAQCFADMLHMAGFSRQRLFTGVASGRGVPSYGIFLASP